MTTHTSTTRPFVLVVEDEDDSRETLREILELEGYRVGTAENGRAAIAELDKLGDAPCIIVLLDLHMPVMTGLEFLDEVRRDGRLDMLKVLITTSAPHMAPPGIPVIGKPIDLNRLLNEVLRLC